MKDDISRLDYQILKERYPNNLDEMLKKVKEGYPIQYLIGNVNFYGIPIKVDERVLIPRFETETLVEKTINYAQKMFSKEVKIIELGTGSGCIAIALKQNINSSVTAIDISKDALLLAKENALLNKTDITFLEHSMEEKIDDMFDIIISNPPYIDKNGYVQDIVKNNEPHIALFAPDNGLYFYKQILGYAFSILHKPGLISFEIGDGQKELLEIFLKTNYPTKRYSFEKDLGGLYRYLFIFNE